MRNLKEIRKKYNLSQQQLADKLGVSRSTIAMWETGGSQADNLSLSRIAELFNVSTDYLLGLTSDPAPLNRESSDEDDRFSWLNDLSPDEIADKCYEDFKILFSRSHKSNHEQMKGFYIDAYKRFHRD